MKPRRAFSPRRSIATPAPASDLSALPAKEETCPAKAREYDASRTGFVPSAPASSIEAKTASAPTPHRSLIALARLLGQQAAREVLKRDDIL